MIQLKFLKLSKNRKKLTSFFFILMILTILLTFTSQGMNLKVHQESIKKPRASKFWVLPGSIVIDDSDIQDWAWAAGQDWCNGSGTLSDPYIIENVTINGGNSSSCIEIRNSNAYFIIRNCTFYNSSLGSYPYYDAGIKLTTVSNGKIIDNNCSYNQGMGIAIYWSSDNNTISRNKANHNQKTGIHIYYYCEENMVSGNMVNDNIENGIYLRDNCHKNDILDNNASNNQNNGIDLSSSDYNTISGNNASNNNNYYGIHISGSEENTISRNYANDNQGSGIFLFWGANNNKISENTAGNIYTTDQNEGILLYFNCLNNSISKNTLNDNYNYGVRLDDKCNNNTILGNIMGNTGSTNQDYGIYLEGSSNNTITENALIKNTQYGAFINSYGENNTFIFNSFIENGLNAEDNGVNNRWNNSVKGNFWSDWISPDVDGDGIVDNPYNISGSAESEDGYPLTNTTPNVTFSVNSTLIYGLQPIKFTYNGTGGNFPLSFEWDFGDNTTSSERNPVHLYNIFGVYTVNLTVYDIHGDNDTESKTEYITVLEDTMPIVNFSANVTLLYGFKSVQFNYTGSGGNLPLNFTWYFGDGANSTEQDPVHVYTSPGAYTVNLTVLDANGDDDVEIKINYITVFTDTSPNANFTVSSLPIVEGQPVQFNYTGSGGNLPLNFTWYFGDGANSTEQDPVHVYTTPGVYTVNLTVLDANGDDDVEIKTNYIVVYADNKPNVNFLVNESTIIEGQSIKFTYNGSGGNIPLIFKWDFGDGTNSTEQDPVHQYEVLGVYTVNLTVIDVIGDIGIKIKYVIVLEDLMPIVNFSIDGNYFIEGRPVQFSFTGSGGNEPLTFYWDFGDGTSSTEQDPKHVFELPGTYVVNLTIIDVNGDRATKILSIVVNTLTNAPSFPAELIFGIFLSVGIVTIGVIVIKRKKNVAKPINLMDIPLTGGKVINKADFSKAKWDSSFRVDHSQLIHDVSIPKIVDDKLEDEELAKMESELDIEKQVFLCVVHKGPVEGQNVYICPHCEAFYCRDCMNALQEQGEKCKSCQNDFT